MRIAIFYDEQDPRNRGWAYSLQTADACESGALPHTRRQVSLATLARSVRQYRGAAPSVRRLVADLTAALRPCGAGDGYEAQS